MLPVRHRFNPRNQRDFFTIAQRFYSPLFTIYYTKNDKKTMRATVIVSKKTAKLSVKRNQLRRKILDAIKQILESRTAPSIDLAVVVKQKSIFASEQEVIQSLDRFLQVAI